MNQLTGDKAKALDGIDLESKDIKRIRWDPGQRHDVSIRFHYWSMPPWVLGQEMICNIKFLLI